VACGGSLALRQEMEDSRFDRLARFLAAKSPRRGLLAAVFAVFAMRWQRVSAQFTTLTCGSEGNVCTPLAGCCAGFTCVTSALNPSYGICITGDGGLITAGTSLIVPGSDGAVAQASAMATAFTSATPVDVHAERQADLQARRDKHDTQLTRRRNQQDERRSKQQTRRSDRRSRRRLRTSSETASSDASANAASTPVVALSVSCPQGGAPQLVTIHNLGGEPIDVAKVGSLLNPIEEEPHTPTPGGLVIDSGVTRQLQFGGADGDVPGALWIMNVPIFDNSPYEGVRLELRTNEVYFACCNGTELCYGGAPVAVPLAVAETKRRRGHRRKKRRQKRSGTD